MQRKMLVAFRTELVDALERLLVQGSISEEHTKGLLRAIAQARALYEDRVPRLRMLSGSSPLAEDFKAKLASDPERYRKYLDGSWETGEDPDD